MIDRADRFQSYCGAPPGMETLWLRWNFDPVLIVFLLIGLVCGLGSIRSRLSDGASVRRSTIFATGWAIASAALVSPLCALSVSLFSARVAQHVILTTIVAPLIALGLPAPREKLPMNALMGAMAFALALWIWHLPGPYDATFESHAAYWGMHLTTFGAALWFWRAALHASPRRIGVSTAATLLAGVQMGLLGAVITFAPVPLYAPHWLTTTAWGLTPLQDQQLGGAIMWIPAGAIVAAAVIVPLGRLLNAYKQAVRT